MGDLKSGLLTIKEQLRSAKNDRSSKSELSDAPAGKASQRRSSDSSGPSHFIPPESWSRPPSEVAKAIEAQAKSRSILPQKPASPHSQISAPVPAIPVIPPVSEKFEPLPKLSGSRRTEFRAPSDWVKRGGASQLQGSWRGAVDVFIGIDFGTSFTKAAVGLKDKIYVVTWGGVSGHAPDYLLPSEYSRFDEGRTFLGQHPHARAEQVAGDLKLPFITEGQAADGSLERASTFLALVIRYVRAFVFENHSSKLGAAKIRWYLNIGAPCNGLEHTEIASTYGLLARSAWRRSLSLHPERVHAFQADDAELHQDLISVEVKPEFVAQLAGYMQSPQRQRGLHAIMDVGGGTLDFVTFNVHERDGEDNFPFLVPEVRPLGTHGLLQNRLLVPNVNRESVGIDELAPVPPFEAFAKMLAVPAGQVHRRDELFQEAVRQLVARVLDVTKRRRWRLADAWDVGVRTFFTGGGSEVAVYGDALRSARLPSRRPLNIIPLPMHPRLDAFDGDSSDYQRISVACGLAQDPWTLGRIVPAKEVDDDKPTGFVPGATRDAPDRDELYPK